MELTKIFYPHDLYKKRNSWNQSTNITEYFSNGWIFAQCGNNANSNTYTFWQKFRESNEFYYMYISRYSRVKISAPKRNWQYLVDFTKHFLWNPIFEQYIHSTAWKNTTKSDHNFYRKINIFSVKSTFLLKSWFHGKYLSVITYNI